MAQSVTHQFQAALVHLLTQEGRGAQSRLAGQQNIDRGYLNAIVKGRKPGSEEVRAKIAAYFGMSYEEMLTLGRRFLSERDVTKENEFSMSGREIRSINDRRVEGRSEKNDNSLADILELTKPSKHDPKISDKILKVVDILESETNYRDVLADLIDTFHEAVMAARDNQKLRNQMNTLEQRLENLEKKLASSKLQQGKSA